MSYQRKLLVDGAEATVILNISQQDLEWLVDTQQLSPIHIRGRRLFMVTQLEELVQTYKTVQSRGK
jgi:hypothetical protein